MSIQAVPGQFIGKLGRVGLERAVRGLISDTAGMITFRLHDL